jgi:hypothetical protein
MIVSNTSRLHEKSYRLEFRDLDGKNPVLLFENDREILYCGQLDGPFGAAGVSFRFSRPGGRHRIRPEVRCQSSAAGLDAALFRPLQSARCRWLTLHAGAMRIGSGRGLRKAPGTRLAEDGKSGLIERATVTCGVFSPF